MPLFPIVFHLKPTLANAAEEQPKLVNKTLIISFYSKTGYTLSNRRILLTFLL